MGEMLMIDSMAKTESPKDVVQKDRKPPIAPNPATNALLRLLNYYSLFVWRLNRFIHRFKDPLIMHCEIFRLRSENADLKVQVEILRKSLEYAILATINGRHYKPNCQKESSK